MLIGDDLLFFLSQVTHFNIMCYESYLLSQFQLSLCSAGSAGALPEKGLWEQESYCLHSEKLLLSNKLDIPLKRVY